MTGTDLSTMGMHHVQLDSIHITVRANFFPRLLLGLNFPMRSMEIKSIGALGTSNIPFTYLVDVELCIQHNLHCLTYLVTSGLMPFQ